jgi:hypothetical protein
MVLRISSNRGPFLLRIDMVRADELRVALDEIIALARQSVRSRRTCHLNEVVEALSDSVDESLEFAIGVLTATLAVKNTVSSRARYLEEVKRSLRSQGKTPEVVLKGLL